MGGPSFNMDDILTREGNLGTDPCREKSKKCV